MLTKKTIQINPELFKIPGGGKTRKNREKKELIVNPNVKPNIIKNTLMKRIREHKNKEINGGKINKPKQTQLPHLTNTHESSKTNNNYSNEFYGALDYLSDLTKKQKMNEAKQRSLNTRTLKNHNNLYPLISNNTEISLELPPELQETKFVPESNDIFNVNYKINDDVPYGCLKNGKKKTYREWKQLSQPDIPNMIRPPTPPKKNMGTTTSLQNQNQNQNYLIESTNTNIQKNLSREERLEEIKNKLKKIQDQDMQIKQQSLDNFKKLEQKLSTPLMDSPLEELELDNYSGGFSSGIDDDPSDIEDIIKERENNNEKEKQKNKKFLKKTIKKKFTLGKSDKLRKVSVLINNNQTRKNIINTQKELKKTSINDVKKYLRQHGMIKMGSTCPNDILRKTFESAVLTGEVTNTNKEILLHNFLSSDKQD
jgi:hypothetical protein